MTRLHVSILAPGQAAHNGQQEPKKDLLRELTISVIVVGVVRRLIVSSTRMASNAAGEGVSGEGVSADGTARGVVGVLMPRSERRPHLG